MTASLSLAAFNPSIKSLTPVPQVLTYVQNAKAEVPSVGRRPVNFFQTLAFQVANTGVNFAFSASQSIQT